MRPLLLERLLDARTEAERALDFVNQHDAQFILESWAYARALERSCEIVGEALRAASESEPMVVAECPDIPWIEAIALRTRLAHGHDSVSTSQLIATVREHFPRLIAATNGTL